MTDETIDKKLDEQEKTATYTFQSQRSNHDEKMRRFASRPQTGTELRIHYTDGLRGTDIYAALEQWPTQELATIERVTDTYHTLDDFIRDAPHQIASALSQYDIAITTVTYGRTSIQSVSYDVSTSSVSVIDHGAISTVTPEFLETLVKAITQELPDGRTIDGLG